MCIRDSNLGVSLAQQGKKVLLIDSDAQANLTMSLGYSLSLIHILFKVVNAPVKGMKIEYV